MKREMTRSLIAAFAVTLLGAAPLFAGNIVLTGHDDDYHDVNDGGSGAGGGAAGGGGSQLAAMIAFARSGSTNPLLPVLSFDQGAELTGSLAGLGIAFVNINPLTLAAGAVGDAVFDPAVYSAFVTASDSTCGGCDNTPAGEANINSHSAAIASFVNAGGGIVGLAGASNAATYYNFVPSSASGFGAPPASGYVQTTCGASLGIPAVNGDPTHNFFFEPGTGGVSAAYCVVERLGSATTGTAETIAIAGAAISTGTISTGAVPEPTSITLLGLGLGGAYLRLRRRREQA